MATLDPLSLFVGAGGASFAMGLVIGAAKKLPGLVASKAKSAIRSAAASGAIDQPTQRLFSSLWRAAFTWADEEMPKAPGDDKMNAILDKASAVPYLGWIVKVDREDAKKLLQTEFEAVQTEVHSEKDFDPLAAGTNPPGAVIPKAETQATPAGGK